MAEVTSSDSTLVVKMKFQKKAKEHIREEKETENRLLCQGYQEFAKKQLIIATSRVTDEAENKRKRTENTNNPKINS
ncbi:hypothetical protein DPMN_090135 [Dreissena polymorpha]|uniref:Uncharacterized protein n=1 Tax=Dreissena polymorpha TaxID=45954 RepID=A0A9D4KX66_DREPO|nr:hypothetical protein DPMN_090135 [Dreissena polymorpha]